MVCDTAVAISELRRRVERLERAHGFQSPAPTAAALDSPGVAMLPAPPAPAFVAGLVGAAPPEGAEAAEPERREALQPRPPAPPIGDGPAQDVDGASLEREIGSRWFAVGGAVVVVIGAALFLKLAWDQGWLGRIPGVWRCVSAAAFGFGLLAVGEAARRRIGQWAAAGLSAAGVGVVYASAYAAYEVFDLVSAPGAFALLIGAAAIGVGVALRAGLASVAFVSLAGAYGAPLLLGVVATRASVFPLHLTTLLAASLVIATLRGGGFMALRALAWWATALLGGAWTLAEGGQHPYVALMFLAAAWAMIHGEVVIAARRADRRGVHGGGAGRGWAGPRHVLSSFGISAWGVSLGVWTLRWCGLLPDWTAPAALFAAAGALALVLAGSLRVLRDPPRTALERVGAALAAQSGAALVATMSLALSGTPETVGWLALGVGAVCAGRWMRSGGLDAFGVVALLVGSARLVILESKWGISPGGYEVGGVVLSRWSLAAIIGAGAWVACARLMLVGADAVRRDAARWFATLALVLILAAPLHKDTAPASLSLLWTALSMLTLLVRTVAPRLRMAETATGGLALATAVWGMAHIPRGWSSVDAALGLHPGLVGGCIIAAAWFVLGFLAPRVYAISAAGRSARALATIVGIGLIFIASSFEVARGAALLAQDEMARLGAISLWWALFGAGLIAAGFWLRNEGARYAGLGLVAVAAGKAMLLDLAMAPPAWRVASFVGIGLLMLGVAVVYARSMKTARIRSGSTAADPA